VTGNGSDATCPVCGRGFVADIAFDRATGGQPDLRQTAESRELVTYSCGHQVLGASVGTADTDVLDAERRTSRETAEPRPSPEGT
jgi:hypothetical protein